MNKNIRRMDRSITDVSEINQIINSAKVLHLGLTDGRFPYIVPLNFGYEYDEVKDCYIFYMHSATIGYKLDMIYLNPNVCVELETDVELISGGDIPCEYGSFYSSVIGVGTASIVMDGDEKKHGLELLMQHQTGKAFDFTEQMIASVAVIKVEVTEYTAKARRK